MATPTRKPRRKSSTRYGRAATAVLAASTLIGLAPQRAHAWATAEHVRFGMKIAEVYENFLGEKLPVLRATNGPTSFGHYVSAPDFARGLQNFLTSDAVIGVVACSVMWNPEGVVDGKAIDDQSHAGTKDGDALLDKLGLPDCVNAWRLNNSHFGDFAANHYEAYHKAAIEAARRYRAGRNETCRSVAYTLEGWGQHYLTDSFASGHAFNPAGSYDIEIGFQTLTGLGQRMRIHNFLNDNGAKMAGANFSDGTYWGDHSEKHAAGGKAVPEQAADDPQQAITLRISRMGLGQVVAAAECGEQPDAGAVLDTQDPIGDPRRLYASNLSMCAAMDGHEFKHLFPNFIDTIGIDLPEVEEAIIQCKDDDGAMTALTDGDALAKGYFPDKFPTFNAEDGFISDTLDDESGIDLDALGCPAEGPITPIQKGELDLCGNALCETPIQASGSCPSGTVASAGCCHRDPTNAAADGEALVSEFVRGPDLVTSELETPGAVAGGAAEFIPLQDAIKSFVGAAKLEPLGKGRRFELAGGRDLDDCGAEASYAVFESRVRIPRGKAKGNQNLRLMVEGMDEGLRVQVDGHVVAYLSHKGTQEVTLVGPAATPLADGTHTIRLTHLNSCKDERPLEVAVLFGDAKLDDLGPKDAGGCAAGGGAAGATGLLLVGLGLFFARRKRS